MTEQSPQGWDRREFLGAAALVALAFGVPAAAVQCSTIASDSPPSAAQRALFREVSQLVIPRTGTPGAGDVGSGDFVLLALAHGLEGSRKPVPAGFAEWQKSDGTLDHVRWLETTLARLARGSFLAAEPAVRLAALTALDAEAYASGVNFHPWRTIKSLILLGYSTSESGASQDLRYEPVPGRWDPDLPQDATTRAVSNDWTAVDFG